ncbi:MAG: hypothetical protein K6E79_10390, partial [Pseudobutyrivibrio sp.]|nr:hypothetical protein [Pseudobutyrivibrio sp.]
NYYNAERDDLAIAMIRYKLVQSGEITADYTISNAIDLGKNTNYLTNTLVYKYWQGSNYYEHHYCVKYVGVDGQYHEMYFDYATCDADGNTLIKNNLSDKNDDNPSNVDGVNIIIKTPIYNTAKMNGNYYQRVGFETYDVTTTTGDTLNTVKGLDWYTKKQYLEDVSKRHSMSAAITSLSEAVISLANEMSETFVSASASAVVSESASEARYQSLTNSQIASTSASELKSESLSTSLSESASASLAASEAANEDVVEPAAYSAAYTASVANNVISVTELDDSVEIANENVPAAGQAVATFTNHNADVFMPTIADNQVPLTVVEDVPEDETIESMFIGDNQVAKSGQALKARTGFIGFITIVIATITTKVGRDKMENSPTK